MSDTNTPQGKMHYRNISTGTVYQEVIFNGTGITQASYNGQIYNVQEKNIEYVSDEEILIPTSRMATYINLGLTQSKYVEIHTWIKLHFGKADRCEYCKTLDAPRYEWSNISHKYTRDRSDWRMLCPSCHHKEDYTDRQRESVGARSRKPVRQFTKDGKLIAEYPSVIAASRATNIVRNSISTNIHGRYKSAGGFVWKTS